MDIKLTIALPTYNRAALLEKQLTWLAQAIKGHESQCEIIISDNCSTDGTPEVISRWRPHLQEAHFKSVRQEENIGAVKNIAFCINSALGKHVWTISDDDDIRDNALDYVLESLNTNPDLALIILNFAVRSAKDGTLKKSRWFDVKEDEVSADGKSMFERLWQVERGGGVQLTTALVYQTELGKRAIEEWPYDPGSLALQFYVTSFCALNGSVKVTKDPFLDCITGRHFFMDDCKVFLTYKFDEVPEAYIRLKELGYSRRICNKMALWQSKEIRRQKRAVLNCFKERPCSTTKVLLRHVLTVGRVLLTGPKANTPTGKEFGSRRGR